MAREITQEYTNKGIAFMQSFIESTPSFNVLVISVLLGGIAMQQCYQYSLLHLFLSL